VTQFHRCAPGTTTNISLTHPATGVAYSALHTGAGKLKQHGDRKGARKNETQRVKHEAEGPTAEMGVFARRQRAPPFQLRGLGSAASSLSWGRPKSIFVAFQPG